jgi:haloacetate dehalogenase
MPDLRGYGDSGKPAGGENHVNYSKRAMARDQVEVMEKLGFQRFSVVGHDRGARVAHRLALDYSDRVTRLVMIDICPTHYMYQETDRVMRIILDGVRDLTSIGASDSLSIAACMDARAALARV